MIARDKSKKEEYAKAVCVFLGEMIRTRNIGLARAAEIAQKVVDHINLIDTEKDFLKFIVELSRDFEELFKLERIVALGVKETERHEMEEFVREHVISIMGSDTRYALEVLTYATQPDAKLADLQSKFPKFKEFIGSKNGKIRI